jgi:hypothetical protein
MIPRSISRGSLFLVLFLAGCADPNTRVPTIDLTGSGDSGGSTSLPANLVIPSDTFSATVVPSDGSLAVHVVVHNAGRGPAKVSSLLHLIKVSDRTPDLVRSQVVSNVPPGGDRAFDFSISPDELGVKPRKVPFKLRVVADASNVIPEGSGTRDDPAENDNTTELSIPQYGADLLAKGIQVVNQTAAQSGSQLLPAGSIRLLGTYANVGNIDIRRFRVRWDYLVKDTDTPACFEQQNRLSAAIARFNSIISTASTTDPISTASTSPTTASTGATAAATGAADPATDAIGEAAFRRGRSVNLPDSLQALVDGGYLGRLPRDPGSNDQDSWRHYINDGRDGVRCSRHGSSARPIAQPDREYQDITSGPKSLKAGQQAADFIDWQPGTALRGQTVVFRLTLDPASSNDDSGQVLEQDETNNVSTFEYTIPEDPTLPKSDVVVWRTFFGWDPGATTLTLWTQLANVSTQPTRVPFLNQWSYSATPFQVYGDRIQSPVKIGSALLHDPMPALSIDNQDALLATPGTTWKPDPSLAGKVVAVQYEADANLDIVEASDIATQTASGEQIHRNALNNFGKWNVRFPPAPPRSDLSTRLFLRPEDGGDTVTARATVRNVGDQASGSFTWRYLVDDVPVSNGVARDLAAASSLHLNLPIAITRALRNRGTLKVTFAVTPGGPDKDPTNDSVTRELRLASAPLLTIDDVTIQPGISRPESHQVDQLIVVSRVTNNGDMASHPFTAVTNVTPERAAQQEAQAGFKGHETRIIRAIFPVNGTDGNTSFNGLFSLVSPQVAAEVDPARAVARSANRVILPPTTGLPLPNLVINDFREVSRTENNEITFQASVENVGTGESAGFISYFNVDGNVSSKPIPGPLTPGATADPGALTFKYTPTKDDQDRMLVTLTVDPPVRGDLTNIWTLEVPKSRPLSTNP